MPQEFLVHMEFNFPPTWTPEVMQQHYLDEAGRATELADAGLFKRVWRIPGRRGHISLWECDDADQLHRALETWPMWMWMDVQVTPLAVNHNDPGGVAEDLPGTPITWRVLYNMLYRHGTASPLADQHEGQTFTLVEGVTIHDHPHSGRPHEIHFMVDGQKVAELGPDTAGEKEEDVAPGYIDFLAEWEGRPVRHARWQRRIERDNGLLNRNYEDALHGSRYSRKLIRGQ